MKKLNLALMICCVFMTATVFGQNYGNFQANSIPGFGSNCVSLGQWHGNGTIDVNTRFTLILMTNMVQNLELQGIVKMV